jgi:hypothetical protein
MCQVCLVTRAYAAQGAYPVCPAMPENCYICAISLHAGADVSSVPRDQGFTRPKALILLPMRNMAFAVVRRLVALAQKDTRADSVQVGLVSVGGSLQPDAARRLLWRGCMWHSHRRRRAQTLCRWALNHSIIHSINYTCFQQEGANKEEVYTQTTSVGFPTSQRKG